MSPCGGDRPAAERAARRARGRRDQAGAAAAGDRPVLGHPRARGGRAGGRGGRSRPRYPGVGPGDGGLFVWPARKHGSPGSVGQSPRAEGANRGG
eukprot:5890608-Lingulodinium_polyedra.AAC.1